MGCLGSWTIAKETKVQPSLRRCTFSKPLVPLIRAHSSTVVLVPLSCDVSRGSPFAFRTVCSLCPSIVHLLRLYIPHGSNVRQEEPCLHVKQDKRCGDAYNFSLFSFFQAHFYSFAHPKTLPRIGFEIFVTSLAAWPRSAPRIVSFV